MKLLAGAILFLLCGLAGEGKARRLMCREQTLTRLCGLVREIGDRQLTGLVSFREAALGCSPSKEREQLLELSGGDAAAMPLLTAEERACLAAYACCENRSMTALRTERDSLMTLLRQARDRTKEERDRKGQVYRSMGYLCGAAVLLLVL